MIPFAKSINENPRLLNCRQSAVLELVSLAAMEDNAPEANSHLIRKLLNLWNYPSVGLAEKKKMIEPRMSC